eukprot:CAMPEP_0178577680 /NCGR_PEP_ID=MMETSP0697-20121206/21133_1 /TAXON_ID=265572 /ORGANISM="Extubocellulus spinifer, Strain CCMP396" /LENGTH=4375 /DNA_ID=CAMNT_0020212987 /DNA_START=145 /DNA_END=13272 /DNA_ORIENTATION=+
MFERLAGKVLTRLLSKYFVQENGDEINSSTSAAASSSQSSSPSTESAKRPSPTTAGAASGTVTQLDVWSGYVALDNLLLKNSVINSHLKSRGLPLQLLRCTVGRVEITVPWGKLGLRGGSSSGIASSGGGGGGGDGAVVVVVDSVHVLLEYEFDDDAMESARIKKRREKLAESEDYVRPENRDSKDGDDAEAADAGTLAGFFKSRLKEGIVNDVLGKIQIHVRDVHVRFEDVDTDPINPQAFGLTLESLHVQSDNEDGGRFGADFNVAEKVSSALDASVHSSSSRSLTAASVAAASSSTRNISPTKMDDKDVVKKMIQINHFAIYWNELDPTGSAGHGPAEIYIIQHLLGKPNSGLLYAQAMNDCIARRSLAQVPSTPVRGYHRSSSGGYYPSSPMPQMSPMTGSSVPLLPGTPSAPIPAAPTLMHTYLLLPMDSTLRTSLSKTPTDLRRGPALSATLSIDALTYELRDFQYSRIVGLGAAMKYHKFAGKYRRHRPRTSVHDDPRAWWAYAIGVVQEELRQNRTRWSFRRFHRGCVVRKRYIDLYERHLWGEQTQKANGRAHGKSRMGKSSSRTDTRDRESANGPYVNGRVSSSTLDSAPYQKALSPDETSELRRIDDGVEGHLEVDEILFLRALVNARMASRRDYPSPSLEETSLQREKGSNFIRGMIQDDFDAEEEYERLLAYLEASSEDQKQKQRFDDPAAHETCISVCLQVAMKYGSVCLFTHDYGSFANLSLASSAQKRFMELSFSDLQVGYSLLGNYDSFEVDFLVGELEGSEVRSDGSRHVLLSQIIRNETAEKDIRLLAPPTLGAMASSVRGFLTPKRSGSNLGAPPTNKCPLMSCRVAWKPPKAPHFDVSLAVVVEEMKLAVSPKCEWPAKTKALFSHKSETPNASDFWEQITMAYINTFKSARAGLQAKAALAFSKHKNIDANILIDCPLICIGDEEDGSRIIIDLGNAYLATESLAGVARGHINGGILRSEVLAGKTSEQVQPSGDNYSASNGSDGRYAGDAKTPDFVPTSENAGNSPTRSTGSFSLGVSAISQPSPQRLPRSRSRGYSVLSTKSMLEPIGELGTYAPGTGVDLLHSCFYDSFSLRLSSIKVSTSTGIAENDTESVPVVQAGFSLIIDKSVISNDHTIPKLKFNCIADELALSLSRTTLTCVGSIFESWSTLPVVDEPTGFNERDVFNIHQHGMTIENVIGTKRDLVSNEEKEEEMSDTSDINEMEFLDAVDTETTKDDISEWFEENWNTDAESLATRSMFGSGSNFRTPRGRLPSISDVSSKSTRSRKSQSARLRTRKVPNAQTYLNAENLARLDESGFDENDSDGESEGSGGDSFHSAISLGGLRRLVDALNDDIIQVEKEIEEQKLAVQEAVASYRAKYRDGSLTSNDKQRHRRRKDEMKIELQRREAELKALRAAYEDAKAELESAERNDYEDELNGNSGAFSPSQRSFSVEDGNAESLPSVTNERAVFVRAQSLLDARRQRASIKSQQHDVQHSLTKWLNRDIFFGAFSAANVSFEILDDEGTNSDGRRKEKILDFSVSGLNASVSKRTFDTRLFGAVEQVFAATDLKEPGAQTLLLNGGVKPDDSRALASQYSHLVSSTFIQEDFLRVGIDIRRRSDKSTGSAKRSFRAKVALGVTEVCVPDENTLEQCFGLVKYAKTCLGKNEGLYSPSSSSPEQDSVVEKLHKKIAGSDIHDEPFAASPSRSIDIVIQADGFSVRLRDPTKHVDAAVCLAGIGARMARQATTDTGCRVQMDFKLTNAQLLDIVHMRELLGRGDIYRPIINARLRSQLVNSDNLEGWVVDGDYDASDLSSSRAWNCHFGAKVHSLSIHVSLPVFQSIKNCVQATVRATKQPDAHEHVGGREEPERNQQNTDIVPSHPKLPLRWRFDAVLSKTMVSFPSDTSNVSLQDTLRGRSGFCVSVTSAISMQMDAVQTDAMAFVFRAQEVLIKRESDGWNVLEPMTVSSTTLIPVPFIPKRIFSSAGTTHAQLQLPLNSPWNNEAARMISDGQYPSKNSVDRQSIQMLVRFSNIRFNYSALACSEMLRTAELLKAFKSEQGRHTSSKRSDGTALSSAESKTEFSFCFDVSFSSLDATIYDEITVAGGSSHKNPLTTMSLRVVRLSFRHSAQCSRLELNLDDASLYDLTTYPGVCILGPISRSDGKTLKGGFTIVAEVKPDTGIAGKAFKFEAYLGNYQMIVLPSMFKTALNFASTIKQPNADVQRTTTSNTIATDSGAKTKSRLHDKSLPMNVNELQFKIQASGFEVIISSRDIAAYVNSRSQDPISVISFRWQASLTGGVRICSGPRELETFLALEASSDLDDVEASGMIRSLLALGTSCSTESYESIIVDDDGDKDVPPIAEVTPRLVKAMTFKLKWDVSNFQILRTSMRLLSSSDLKKRGIDSAVCCFVVRTPAAGEQQIVSPFNFNLLYNLAATAISGARGASEESRAIYNASHAIKVNVNYIDVLLYIKQSTGGINEALQVSVMPILGHIKDQKDREDKNNRGVDETEAIPSSTLVAYSDQLESGGRAAPSDSAVDILKGSIACLSLDADGFRVTVVPGGATRLTENPIIKFSVSDLKIGFGSSPIRQSEPASQGLLEPVLANIEVAAWYECELSAHYHNKKLVSWEPFLEPWKMQGSVACDVTKAFKLPPMLLSSGRFASASPSRPSAVTSFLQSKGFSGLFSSVQADGSTSPTNKSTDVHALDELYVQSSSGAAYALLVIMNDDMLRSAMLPDLVSDRSSIAYSSGRAKDWLSLFSYPQMSVERNRRKNRPSVMLRIQDCGPMNVNFTGAFISDAVGLLSDELQSHKNKQVAPHLIRNESGMTVRIREVLDSVRIERGEKSPAIILRQGKEIPLSLKRDMTQSCNPHQAYISLEIGSFDHGEAGSENGGSWNKLLHSQYRAVGRVPVDSVGVHTFVLHRTAPVKANIGRANDPSLIVRVALRGGVKIVSIESPIILCNTTGREMYCEIAAHKSGKRLLHGAIAPAAAASSAQSIENASKLPLRSTFPIPVHFVPLIDQGLLSLSISCSEDAYGLSGISSPMAVPPRFSKNSANRGMIKVSEMSLVTSEDRRGSRSYINCASVRIGSLPDELVNARAETRDGRPEDPTQTTSSSAFIPEQRLVRFRPPVAISNYLATAIRLQVRVKGRRQATLQTSLSWMNTRSSRSNSSDGANATCTAEEGWVDLGIVHSGESTSWLGAKSSDRVEMRVKLLMGNARGRDFSRAFPHWSTPITVPAEDYISSSSKDVDLVSSSKMVVQDAGGTNLPLSLALEARLNVTTSKDLPKDDAKEFAHTIGRAPRSLAIFVPLWVVDSTGIDLEYATSSSHIAGQVHPDLISSKKTKDFPTNGDERDTLTTKPLSVLQHGLADLLQDDEFAHLEGRSPFCVYMVGEERPKKLSIRRQVTRRKQRGLDLDIVSSVWSSPISLRVPENKKQDVSVRPPRKLPWSAAKQTSQQYLEPLALRSRMTLAPERLGGRFGTKLVHIVNRYSLVNLLDQDLEVVARRSRNTAVVRVGGNPLPFHFSDNGTIRIRPRDYGWVWCSPFHLRRGQREMYVRLRNRLTGRIMIVQIELREASKAPGVYVEFRTASHPPFRLENHTTVPIQFYQPVFGGIEGVATSVPTSNVEASDTIIVLPYHSANYAWDRPDEAGRSIRLEIADFGLNGPTNIESLSLGQFYLDNLVPGPSKIKLSDQGLSAEIIADGPTRVFRISDASLPAPSRQHESLPASQDFSIEVRLVYGLGVSVIDWTPTELVYFRLTDVALERELLSSNVEEVTIQVGSVVADNQLWVTPYPNLLTVGSRFKDDKRRRKGRAALKLTMRRDASRCDTGGVTMLQSLDFSTLQQVVKADGALVDLLVKMLKKASSSLRVISERSTQSLLDFRDAELWQALGLDDRQLHTSFGDAGAGISEGKEKDAAMTAANASKAAMTLEVTARPNILANSSPQGQSHVPMGIGGKIQQKQPPPATPSAAKPTRKFYIERMKISAINANISWTGKLPFTGTLPALLTPALTFEGLPLTLRSYSSSHSYGTLSEQVRKLKGHYFSLWRIFDVMLGITFKPTFMIRAYAYTWQQSAAIFFEGLSDVFSRAGDLCAVITPGRHVVGTSALVWGEAGDLAPLDEIIRSGIPFRLYSSFVGGVTGSFETIFRGIAAVNAGISSSLRYDGASHLLEEANTGRTRPPRLFANEDGNDLLVEYVEGENAGRALLSRVRMGAYLGEGYVCHGEGATFIEGSDLKEVRDASQPMIYIMTSQRLLLLKGGSTNLNFCTDVWGVSFERTIQVHAYRTTIEADDVDYCVFEIMYFEKESEEVAHRKSQTQKYLTEHVGLGKLHCSSIQFPAEGATKLIIEISRLTDVKCFGDFVQDSP